MSADFLPDGRVALAVQVPPTGERQAWAYDPVTAAMERLGHAAAPGALPSSVAIAPDGLASAAIVHLAGLDGASADRLTIEDAEGVHDLLADNTLRPGEHLLDISWSPNGDGLVVLGEHPVRGGKRYDLRFVGRAGAALSTAELPAQPVSGSWMWAADGHAVAFLARGKALALATFDVANGQLRYIDDLGGTAQPGVGAVPPATWDQSGRILYAAPARAGTRAGTTSPPVLLAVDAGRTDAHRVGTIEPVFAPIVPDDGVLLTLARGADDMLILRPVDPSGQVLAEQNLGVSVAGTYAARWDLRHGQILILRGGAGAGLDLLLLRFVVEGVR
jgi:hypothetical protein